MTQEFKVHDPYNFKSAEKSENTGDQIIKLSSRTKEEDRIRYKRYLGINSLLPAPKRTGLGARITQIDERSETKDWLNSSIMIGITERSKLTNPMNNQSSKLLAAQNI